MLKTPLLPPISIKKEAYGFGSDSLILTESAYTACHGVDRKWSHRVISEFRLSLFFVMYVSYCSCISYVTVHKVGEKGGRWCELVDSKSKMQLPLFIHERWHRDKWLFCLTYRERAEEMIGSIYYWWWKRLMIDISCHDQMSWAGQWSKTMESD